MRQRLRRGKTRAQRSRRHGAALAVAAALALGDASAARAETRSSELPELARELESCGGSGPDSLLVTLVRVPAAAALRDAVCDWFQDEPWRVRFRVFDGLPLRSPEPSAGELLVNVTLTSFTAAQLSITAPARERSSAPAHWLEPVALRNGLDEVGVEVIAQSLHSTAQASLSRAFPADTSVATIVTTRAPRALDEPAAVVTPGVSLPVHTALGYQFYVHGPEPLTHGPSLRIELDWFSGALVLGSFVRTALFTSTESHVSGVDLGLEGIGLGGGLSASLPWQRWTARLALGTNVDLLGVDVSVQDRQSLRSFGGGKPHPRVFLTAEAGLAARLGRVELGLASLLRWQTTSSYYQLLEGGEPQTIVRAWRFQPGATLELAYVW